MRVRRYWHCETRPAEDSDGRALLLHCWAGSETSVEDARERAVARAARWVERLARGEEIGEYEYRGDEVREELVREVRAADGELLGAITRNRYGALVLNVARVFIADVDVPPTGAVARWLARFGRRPRDKAFHLERVREFAERRPSCSVRVYETRAGLRVFVLGEAVDPRGVRAEDLHEALGSDRLYRRLCRAQGCFRARLTAKPWRCGAERPPNRFPRREERERRAFAAWLTAYDERRAGRPACRRICDLGPEPRDPAELEILRVHDEFALGGDDAALA